MNSPAPTARARGPRVFLDYNHQELDEIAETLANPYGHVGRAVLGQAGLARARA